MSTLAQVSRSPRIVLVAALLLVVGLAALAYGQIGAAKPAARHFEFVHQEVQANTVTQSLNDLDAQGWEVFQVIPSWQIKNENADTVLAPRSYEVFGRRPVAPK